MVAFFFIHPAEFGMTVYLQTFKRREQTDPTRLVFKGACELNKSYILLAKTDEDPGLRIEGFAKKYMYMVSLQTSTYIIEVDSKLSWISMTKDTFPDIS